jgi:PAS domain S-box-containing protein
VSISFLIQHDASGTLIGAVNMLIDISDRKRADAQRQRLAAIVESSEDAIFSKDLNGIITSWNHGAELLFGYSAEEAIGKPITILIPPDLIHEEPEIIERVRKDERVDQYDTVRRRKDGSLIDISLTVSPLKDADGRIIGASKIARDITERKRAQQMCA